MQTKFVPDSSGGLRWLSFPMKVWYEFEEASNGTVARIRIQGEASGFYKLAGPMMSRAVKRNITNDLETLKDLLEAEADEE